MGLGRWVKRGWTDGLRGLAGEAGLGWQGCGVMGGTGLEGVRWMMIEGKRRPVGTGPVKEAGGRLCICVYRNESAAKSRLVRMPTNGSRAILDLAAFGLDV